MTDMLDTAAVPQEPQVGGKWHGFAKLALAVLIASLAMKWSWATVVADLFGAPDLRYSDAFSIVLALALVALVLGAAFRIGMSRFDR
jgi:hypothetical protein